MASQTAYGVEVECEGYPFSETDMLFMDYRRMHTGDAAGPSAEQLLETAPTDEVPSFLYAMPVRNHHGPLVEHGRVNPSTRVDKRAVGNLETPGGKVTFFPGRSRVNREGT